MWSQPCGVVREHVSKRCMSKSSSARPHMVHPRTMYQISSVTMVATRFIKLYDHLCQILILLLSTRPQYLNLLLLITSLSTRPRQPCNSCEGLPSFTQASHILLIIFMAEVSSLLMSSSFAATNAWCTRAIFHLVDSLLANCTLHAHQPTELSGNRGIY